MPGRGTRWTLIVSVMVDTVLLGGCVLAAIGHSAGAPYRSPAERTILADSGNTSGVGLTVSPPTFSILSGTSVALVAVWSGGPPFCEVTPLWYEWSIPNRNATGFLNGSAGPTTQFTGEAFDSGTTAITVRSEAVMMCGPNATPLLRANDSNISVVAPLSLSDIGVSPNPVPPGLNASLSMLVEGGEPPYSVRIAWGDGTDDSLSLPESGWFTANHSFAPGDFVPAVSVVDDYGNSASGTVAEAVSVGTGLEVAIRPDGGLAEEGQPISFTGVVENAPAGEVTFFDCTNATAIPEGSPGPNESVLACTFDTAGTARVFFGAFPPAPGGPTATAVLYEPVAPPPSVQASYTDPQGEVGGTAVVRVVVSGGVPPFAISWNLSGVPSFGGEEALGEQGGGVLPVPLEYAGEFSVQLRVTDSNRVNATNITGALTVEPTLVASPSAGVQSRPAGEEVQVRGSVLFGCDPFAWWVVAGYSPQSESPVTGNLSNPGAFSWNASYFLEGNLSVTIEVVDGCGATSLSTLNVSLVPSVRLFATATGDPNGTVVLNLSIHGGEPPFLVTVNASDNDSWNRTFDSDGTFGWPIASDGNGSVVLSISLRDAWDASSGVRLIEFLDRPAPPPSPAPEPAPPPSGLPVPPVGAPGASPWVRGGAVSVVLGVIGAGGLALLLRRRRTRRDAKGGTPPDPVRTLRAIIEPADGAERFTVELLAEEAGISLSLVRSTIDRLIADRTIHSENGADGEEVLSWSNEGAV